MIFRSQQRRLTQQPAQQPATVTSVPLIPEGSSAAPAPSSQQVTKQAVTPQVGNPINNPVAPVPLHYGKKFYLYTGKLPAISIPDVLTSGIGGYIENLDEHKTSYEKDELILTIKNFELESRMAATQATLALAKDTLARLEKANETQAATSNELEDARKEVQRLENQLAQDTAKEALGAVKAPNKLTIRDFQMDNGASVREGSPLFSYFDGDRVRLDIYLPISAHSNDFDLTLDGKPVKSITGIDWLPTTSTATAHLSLIVTPADPIPQGKKVTVALKVYSPDKTFNKLLNTIVSRGSTS